MMHITPENILAYRIKRSFLNERAATPRDVAERLIAVQSQVLSAGLLATAIRTGGPVAEVAKELVPGGALVKTWAMRSTLHLASVRDLPMLVSVFGPPIRNFYESSYELDHGISKRRTRLLAAHLAEILHEGLFTRRELSARAAKKFGSEVKPLIESGWGGMVKYLCVSGDAVFASPRGSDVRFMHREQYVDEWSERDNAEAGDELVMRYLTTYGPATPSDLSHWLGLPRHVVSKMWKRIEKNLEGVSVGKRSAYIPKAQAEELAHATFNDVHIALVPHFDVYLLAHRKKEHLIDTRHYKKVYRQAGWITPSLLVNGRINGTWESDPTKGRQRIVISPFTKLLPSTKQLIRSHVLGLEHVYETKCRLKLMK